MEDLNRADADTSIFCMTSNDMTSNGINYFQHVFDPPFYADRAASGNLRGDDATLYGTTNPTSVPACIDHTNFGTRKPIL